MDRKSLVKAELVGNNFVIRMNSVAITEEFLTDLNKALDDIAIARSDREVNKNLEVIIFKSEIPNIFLAGADLKHMEKCLGDNAALENLIDLGHQTFSRIESLDKTTIAAIDGACLGGGFELALACDYRIASSSKSTKIGLPEVNLGILPAWGGTTRLPRLIGVIPSLKVILTGSQNPAKYAKKLGLVDHLVHSENLEETALNFKSLSKKVKRKNPFLRNPINLIAYNQAKKNVLYKTAGNYPAPLEIINTIKKSCSVSKEESFKLEKDAFLKLANTDVCKNLIRIFFLQEKSKKISYNDIKNPSPIKRVCVTGAGTMGAGIAQWLSSRGLNVTLKDVDEQLVANGLKTIGDLFVEGVRGHKLDRPSARDGLSRITSAAEDISLVNHDLVIEAIVEDLTIKRKVLRSLEERSGPNTIIATNTSALSIDDMSTALERPENFIGIHFFNPVHKMKLVEIVVGKQTSDETVARAVKFVQKISKLPIVVKDSPGFVVNRILMPYLIEAVKEYENGADPVTVDKEMVKWGMPMGPFRLMDEIGIDVCLHVAKDLSDRLGFDIPASLDQMVKDKHLGKKTGQGFYKYKKGKTIKGKPKEASRSAKLRIIENLSSSMIYEATKVLKERVAENADDIDFAMIMGTGFAPFKGGPLNYKEQK